MKRFFFVVSLLAVSLAAFAEDKPKPALEEVPADTTAFPDSIRRYRVTEPIRSAADEMTLREIIQKTVEGEKTKLAGHRNMTFNATVRSILTFKRKKEVRDQVFLVYEDDRGVRKFVELVNATKKYKKKDDSWVLDENQEEGNVQVGVAEGTRGENLAQVPFFLEDQQDFDFELEERSLAGETVIFKIRFRPRTKFKPLPSGTVYVDATRFRIVHEEFTFDENPLPLILKDVKRISRQWMELPGGQWVESKIMGEAELQGGWTGFIPGRVEVSVAMNDYRFDQGYDEHRFGPYDP